jgi:hypothetical protein
MNEETKNSQRRRTIKPVAGEAFANTQMALFRGFLANTEAEREALSNAVDLWDSVPRYSVSRARMNTLRTPDGFLPVLEIPFNYRGTSLTAVIYPAQVKTRDSKQRVSFYPSAREELVEHALRRISAEQQAGFFDRPGYRSGATFSLYHLRRELERNGHSLRYDEIIEALDVLSLSFIEIVSAETDSPQPFARSPYLPGLKGVRRVEYQADRAARWGVLFHPLVTQSIDRVTYRQFNYQRLMQCSTQLARWLLGQLVLKYTQAAMSNSFEMRFSTIQRDSALLSGYKVQRQAVAALDEAWEELKTSGALNVVKKVEQRGARKKIEDVVYTIFPSQKFASEQKAANKRNTDGRRTVQSGGSVRAAALSHEGRSASPPASAVEKG